MIIAVDFDGTIVEHKFPGIGEERPGAIETLKKLQSMNNSIVIWTCRCEPFLAPMTRWLGERGFVPDAIIPNVVPVVGFAVPKILADVYIDDRNLGGVPDWNTIFKMLTG